VLVKDIAVGPDGSFPGFLTDLNGVLVFAANNIGQGRELWRSDGTAAGTVLVKDIAPSYSPTKSDPLDFVKSGQRVFFVANNDSTGPELWALPLQTLTPPRVSTNRAAVAKRQNAW
jgi:ELWxxDGT repeat protein